MFTEKWLYELAVNIWVWILWWWIMELVKWVVDKAKEKYGKKILAKMWLKMIPYLWRAITAYVVYQVIDENRILYERCESEDVNKRIEGKLPAYWCGRLMANTVWVLIGIGWVKYMNGKVVWRYKFIKNNEILRYVNEIKDGWDLIRIAERIQYSDKAIKWWAIFVKWERRWVDELMKRFEEMWRKKEVKPWWVVYVYTSPDGKWSINYRTISSSKDKVEKAGYKLEVTLDVMDVVKKKLKEKPYQKEIKFILLK